MIPLLPPLQAPGYPGCSSGNGEHGGRTITSVVGATRLRRFEQEMDCSAITIRTGWYVGFG